MKKYSLAIIDDDLVARNTIKSYLEGSVYQVVREFQSPKNAFEWLRSNDVSLLLCDMKMPQINGVELIEMIRLIHPYIPIIVISNFEDFEFARGCIRNNVSEYLLKSSITKNKLLSVLDQVREQYHMKESEFNSENPIFFDSGDEFSFDHITALIADKTLVFEPDWSIPLLLSLDYPIKENTNWKEYRKDNCTVFIDIIQEVLGTSVPYFIHQEKNNLVMLFLSFSFENRDPSMMQKILGKFREKLRRKVFRLLDLSITIIEGKPGDLTSSLAQTKELLIVEKAKIHWAKGSTVSLPYLVKDGIEKTFFAVGFLDVLQCSFLYFDNQLMQDVVDAIFNELDKQSCQKTEIILVSKKILALLAIPSADTYLMQIQHLSTLHDFILQECTQQMAASEDKARKIYPSSIFCLMKTVETNYQQNLSLEKYADSLQLSYTYLSREFKEKTGFRFVEFVNLVKINRAKFLLLRHMYTMKQIVDLAGFKNYNYFFKVFKDAEHLTPIEYIAKNCSLS